MTVAVAVEPWSVLTDEDKSLCERHWYEIAHNRETIPLKPDWGKYKRMADAGIIHLTTAREDGKLIGYLVYIVSHHLHYSTSLTAYADVLYLVPEKRSGSGVGLRLIRFAEKDLKLKGVQRVLQNVKVDNDWSPILCFLGYKPFETIYSKLLG